MAAAAPNRKGKVALRASLDINHLKEPMMQQESIMDSNTVSMITHKTRISRPCSKNSNLKVLKSRILAPRINKKA